jgi:hypothetical protein
MTLAEKLAAEWEARHDVAARGRIGDVAAVQHYLTHVRCEQNCRAAVPHADPPPSTGARRERAGVLRQWLRWGEDR